MPPYTPARFLVSAHQTLSDIKPVFNLDRTSACTFTTHGWGLVSVSAPGGPTRTTGLKASHCSVTQSPCVYGGVVAAFQQAVTPFPSCPRPYSYRCTISGRALITTHPHTTTKKYFVKPLLYFFFVVQCECDLYIGDDMVRLVFILIWVAGVVIAKGFWSTFFAVIIPFWGWYLLVEKVLMIIGIVS